MNNLLQLSLKSFLLFFNFAIFLSSCNDSNEIDNVEPHDSEDVLKTDISITKVDDVLFSVPSPIQLSQILQSSGAAYDVKLLNDVKKVDEYSISTIQAINLGIYGADLGYSTLYDNQQDALKYMRAAKKLADVLGISNAFEVETLDMIERNLDNKDSLLYIVSNTYRKADEFLQIEKRKHIGAFIVVGGWLESLYFATQIGVKQENADLLNMVGMQKHTLLNLIEKVLIKYMNEDGAEELYDDLVNLYTIYEDVEIKYTYVASEHDRANKTTILKSNSEVLMSQDVFVEIAKQIELIRKKIIQ